MIVFRQFSDVFQAFLGFNQVGTCLKDYFSSQIQLCFNFLPQKIVYLGHLGTKIQMRTIFRVFLSIWIFAPKMDCWQYLFYICWEMAIFGWCLVFASELLYSLRLSISYFPRVKIQAEFVVTNRPVSLSTSYLILRIFLEETNFLIAENSWRAHVVHQGDIISPSNTLSPYFQGR